MKEKKEIKKKDGTKNRTIDRKEALKKTGYIALSAATMMFLLNKPANAQPGSSPASPGGF